MLTIALSGLGFSIPKTLSSGIEGVSSGNYEGGSRRLAIWRREGGEEGCLVHFGSDLLGYPDSLVDEMGA